MTAATPATSWPLTCPADRAPLAAGPDAFACPACRRRYPVAAGVVDFLEAPNSFYEGAYQNETRFLPRGAGLLHEWPLWLISNGYIWAARRFLRSGDRVLELGCAGGVAYMALLRLIDETAGRALPRRWGRVTLLVAEKP